MQGADTTEPEWVGRVSSAPRDFIGDKTIIGLFQDASPDLSDRQKFIELVGGYLAHHQELLETWQVYSYDKRVAQGPYLEGTDVGFYAAGRRAVQHYERSLDACAAFIYLEAAWVLERKAPDW